MSIPPPLFVGRAWPLPDPASAAIFGSTVISGRYSAGDPGDLGVPAMTAPRRIQHAEGYARFVEFAESRHAPVDALASDIAQLIDFLRSEASAIGADPELQASAAIFFGNSIVRLRPPAYWQSGSGLTSPEVGDDTMRFVVTDMIARLPLLDQDEAASLVVMLREWAVNGKADDEEFAAATPLEPRPAPLAEHFGAFELPAIEEKTYLDAAGQSFRYGDRWKGGPPDETYSVVSHPERFAPLHEVADALVEYLVREYDVTVEDDPDAASELSPQQSDVLRAVRLTPARADAAPLVFLYTAYPGLHVHAGVLSRFAYPDCGCDACDETAGPSAETLVRDALSVVAGGFAERYPVGHRRWLESVVVAADGSGSGAGSGGVEHLPRERLDAAQARLAALADNWQGWPARSH